MTAISNRDLINIEDKLRADSGYSVIDVTLSPDFAQAMNAPANERIAEVTDFLAFLTNYGASIVSNRCLFERWIQESRDRLNAVDDEDKKDMHERGYNFPEEVELEILQELSPEKMNGTEFAILVPHDRAEQLMKNLERRHGPKFETLHPDT